MWVYLFDDFSALDENFIDKNLENLPQSRQEKCARYRYDSDKKACIVSYMLLSKGLRVQYGLQSSGEFCFNQHGKPYLKDHPHIFFNLSHCKYGAVCALADTEVGVDIQDIRPYDAKLARRVCSEREMQVLSLSKDPARLFCRIWTEKESYAKAEGISVVTVFRKDLPDKPAAYRETDNYCMTLRCKGSQCEAAQAAVILERLL